MASLLASLLIKLGLDSGEFKSGLTVAEKDLQKATRRIEKIGQGMVNTGKQLSAAVTLPITAMAGLAVKGALEQRAAIAQVDAAIASMGNTAGRSSEQLAKAADAMEMNSLFDADVILTKVTANLLTFGNVSGEVFDRAQQAAIDMAQRMGSDPQAAAIMLGKALNDPIRGIAALSRVGVQLSESQKEQIKAFVKTGEAAKAQGIILAEVERQFSGAAKAAADTSPWRQAQVAINQAGDAIGEAILPVIPVVADAVADLARAFSNLSPTMQSVVLIAAAVAAAFGPILVAVGSLTTSLAARLAPALVAFKAGLNGVAAAEVTATAATGAFSAALRVLMIASGVGAAITVLAGAVYLFTMRTKEAVPASRAYSQALNTAEQTAKDARSASENLAKAMGKEREAALKAATAQQVLAAQRLKAAQARLLQAEFNAKAAAAEARRTASLASGGGPGEGVQGRISPSQQRFNTARRAFEQADADATAAEKSVITLIKAKADLDRAIGDAGKPIKLGTIDVGKLDAGAEAASRAGRSVSGLGREAKAAADPLKELMDALFPEEVQWAETLKNQALLKKSLDAGKISADRYSDAVLKLWQQYFQLNETARQQPALEIEYATGPSLADMVDKTADSAAKALSAVSKKAEATKVQVIESFSQMVDGALNQIDRFVKGIKSGNWLDIIGGLLNAIDKIAAIVTGGTGTSIGPFTFGKGGSGSIPPYANGTNFHPGGLAIVGERGPELLNLPRGSQVKSNRELEALGGGAGAMTVRVVKGDLFDVVVERTAGRVVEAATPGIASAGASMAIGRLRRGASRDLNG